MPLVIPLAALAALFVAYGMLIAYRGQSEEADGSIKGLLLWLADKMEAVRVGAWRASAHPLRPVADALRWFANAVETALAGAVSLFEWPVVQFWHKLAELIDFGGKAVAALALATERRFRWSEDVHIPRAIRLALLGALGPVTAALAAIHALRTVAIPELRRGLDWTRGRVGRLEREASQIRARLRRAEAYLTKAGAVVLVATGLARLGLKWVRCGKVAKVGKRLCAMDSGLLDTLLAGTLLLGGAVSLDRLTRDLLDQAEIMEAALRRGFTELRELPPT